MLDYLGLLRQVRRVGDRLTSSGIGGGDRVGIHICSGTAELYLSILPVLPDGKADRKHLPALASSGRLGADQAYVAPSTPGEKALAGALAELLGLEQVSVDSQFFDDLGLSSLLVAHFCARARERADSPPLSVRDVYQHPTVRSLAAAVTELPGVPGGATSPPQPGELSRTGTAQYVACGALQLLAFLASVFLATVIISSGYSWISGSSGWTGLYLRSLAFSARAFSLLCGLPILAKWTLVGRWKPREITIWNLRYLRFWLVKTLVQADPLALFAGSPVYPLCLRALGAKIGRRVVIFSRTVPVCTDMLTIGDDTVIRRESSFTGYRAVAGIIQTGPVSIGREALVGDHTVLDIGTTVGNGSQLGHTSTLYESQAVPDGQRWHGSPAQRADVDYRSVNPIPSGSLRRLVHYLRAVGYRLPDFEQTGSNFGADLEHETPFLIDIGRGTMIADGATLIDAGYSSTSFRVMPLSIGPRNFLGNAVAYPAGGRTGENCLIATKAMVPLDGPVRANTGLLGSPCFEIPARSPATRASTTSGPGRSSAAGSGPRTGTTSAPWGCSWPSGGSTPSSLLCSPWRRGSSTVAMEYSCS